MTTTSPTSIYTLGAVLERDRLRLRAGRATLAVAALRQRANEQSAQLGAPTTYLYHAIADFEAQIEAMTARLRDLAPANESGRA
ncbi:MAG TPA: hypothetical protein VHV75_15870 [Solirubrobacteraceae bacterium]|jgi:hypothetical protein|nr:hypothetical protein [Solirubrobacteraceae bacterium]